jgi:lysozyme
VKTQVIDLSHWNTVKSFIDIGNAGVLGVIHKCTEGTGYMDPTYLDRMYSATEADLSWGAYHFLKHGNIQRQMEWFVENMALPAGSRVAIDYEDPACTLSDLQDALVSLTSLDPTLQIAIYSGHLIKDQVGSKSYPWLEPFSLWLAQYTTGTPSWPKQIWPVWSLWQFTDTGSVSGMSGNVDLNQFNGSDEQCLKWFGLDPVPAPSPSPHPGDLAVVVNIEVPEGVSIKVTVNGDPVANL